MSGKFMEKFAGFMGFQEVGAEELSEQQPVAVGQDSAYDFAQSPSDSRTLNYPIGGKNRVVNIHTNAQLKIDVVQPKAFEDSVEIVDCLRAKRPVILNLEAVDPELARKIFDFLSGALCAIDGKAEKISKGIFLMAPQNVDINGRIVAEDITSEKANAFASPLFKFK